MDATIDRAAEIAALGLTVDAVFVPFSQSRNKDEKLPSLNWRVTVKRNGRDVLACDYSAGMAHCPCYSQLKGPKTTLANDAMIRAECEKGRAVFISGPLAGQARASKPILPDPLNVLYSLHSDADALNFATFEDWAASFGYDPDSRSAEATYRACLEIGLKLRAALGEEGLAKMSEIFQDY